MDVTFNNVLEGTRQYFMGVPKASPSQGGSTGQPLWPVGVSLHEEGAPGQSGAPTPTSRPPSTAAASAPSLNNAVIQPPRPPSEPLEPEPHIIHKATVMREALEKRRERSNLDDEEEDTSAPALSPPSHIIRKPLHALPSPAPAPAAPCPSPSRPPSAASYRPPSAAPTPPQPRAPTPRVQRTPDLHTPPQNAPHPPRVSTHSYQHSYCAPSSIITTIPSRDPHPGSRPVDHYNAGRPPDCHTGLRPSETTYPRYSYEPTSGDRNAQILVGSSPRQPSAVHPRHSPQQTFSRISNSAAHIPQNPRLRDSSVLNLPTHRYGVVPAPAAAPPPPSLNDRVPPIHHPSSVPQRITSADCKSAQLYSASTQRVVRDPYTATPGQYERHLAVPQRKYDHQQNYRLPSNTTAHTVAQQRVDPNHTPHLHYKHVVDPLVNHHYPSTRPSERIRPLDQMQPHDSTRFASCVEYPNMTRAVEDSAIRNADRNSYQCGSSAPTVRYSQNTSAAVTVPSAGSYHRNTYRPTTISKQNYVYTVPTNASQTSPTRSGIKAGYASAQARMTVSVTSLVNQMNQTKHKRESPLDLSVKTVKNSADSSTTQDDIDCASIESKAVPLQPRPSSNSRHVIGASYDTSHKVDFAPDFHSQYRERNINHAYNPPGISANTARYNGAYDGSRPVVDHYSTESRQPAQSDHIKYAVTGSRPEYPVSRIDLTKNIADERHSDTRIRDDRHYVLEDSRKRLGGPVVSNIPEKIVRYETWSADSRINRLSRSAQEQHELMSRPVYSYSSLKRLEAYQSDIKRPAATSSFKESHAYHRYPYNNESALRDANTYHRHVSVGNNSRHIIQKIPSHRDIESHRTDHRSGGPADKRVLSILRNSLETKHILEPARPARQIPDLIVIDDVDDSVIEITDLTKEIDSDNRSKNTSLSSQKPISPNISHKIHIPKAVDSMSYDSDSLSNFENSSDNVKSKSPENDVASRIRTKAELKVMPSAHERPLDIKQEHMLPDKVTVLPKSQKQHLFNQMRADNLRLESVIKTDKADHLLCGVKTEPMSVDEIEKDAELLIKTEDNLDSEINVIDNYTPEEELNWANACESFMEQLKTGCHKKKPRRRRRETDHEFKMEKSVKSESTEISAIENIRPITPTIVKQEILDNEEVKNHTVDTYSLHLDISNEDLATTENFVVNDEVNLNNPQADQNSITNFIKTEVEEPETIPETESFEEPKTFEELQTFEEIKEESESTDDDEPLIKSKILKDKKEKVDRLKYQLLKDLSEKSAYVKLECFKTELNKLSRANMTTKDHIVLNKPKTMHILPKTKKSLDLENNKRDKRTNSSSDSDSDDVSVASRLRVRKTVKSDDSKTPTKTPTKASSSKKHDLSNPARKPGFGDGSDFHPGWEEEVYRYKRSLRMPSNLIAIPRGRSGGPFSRSTCTPLARGSTSLPDLDPVPLSPAPSSAPSAATDDLFARRQDKLAIDSDLDSNSSCSVVQRLHYDSEASTSTVFSTKKKGESILDVLIQKYGKKDDTNKKKIKEDVKPKVMSKSTNMTELLQTPSLGLIKNNSNGSLSAKKEKLMEDIFYLGAFRKETVTAYRNAFINNTDGLIGATEEFAPLILKSRTRTESRVLKQRATIKEVFGDERPASAPPSSFRDEDIPSPQPTKEIKKDPEEPKIKRKANKIREKLKRTSSSIRDGLRSTKSLKRNDANGRLLRLKKRNNLMKSISHKKMRFPANKQKQNFKKSIETGDIKPKEDSESPESIDSNKKRFRRLFGRRKLSSGFDYIRKKKKIIRREEIGNKIRRTVIKPSPESVQDIHKEIKCWIINKGIGETQLHRAAKLGYTDCVAYCLEKMGAEVSARDNAGFTPLHVAAARGHVRIARLLLQYGADVSAAAQGGIRPLHEASENCQVEVIRLLLSYGADPLLGTYSGQTPTELAEGLSARLLRFHIADVQGQAVEPWRFHPPAHIIDAEDYGGDPLSSPPVASPPPPENTLEIQCTDVPLPPFYSLRPAPGQPIDGLWCMLQDITSLLQIKSKDSLLKQIHCGSGSPKELLRELRTQEFLERAQCHQLLCAGEKLNVRASKVALVRVTDKLRQMLKIETVMVS